jgi:protein-L-isoaspartate(D-aspartate) O-methyltransferase
MISPKIEARLLQCLNVGPDDTVLEIGAGSGHFAALLGTRARNVITLEVHPGIAALARANLQRAGMQNVVVVEADGATGLEAARTAGMIDAEFRADVIVISGSVPAVPAAYVDMLKPGGRLVAFVGEDPLSSAEVITRQPDGTLSRRTLLETRVPALHNAAVPSKFKF